MTAALPDDEVLSARALVKSHKGSPALRGISLGVRRGEILAVTGPRGSGKSTLLSCLSGHLLPDGGEVWFGGMAVHTLSRSARERLRRKQFGWIGTEPALVPELTACENAALPLLLGGAAHGAARSVAQEWMERLDISDSAGRLPGELLQSERQRVAIARALITGPSVLFADEPTAPMHRPDQGQILRTLTAACRSHGITIVLATNDAEVADCADRKVALVDGRRVGGDPGVTEPADRPVTADAGSASASPSPGGGAVADAPEAAAAAEGTAGGRTVGVAGHEGAGRCSASA